jgi:hypothetical protein
MKKYRNLRVLARFRPMTTNDLNSELINLVGKEAEFRYHKFIEEDDTPYSDQWVLTAEDQQFGDYRRRYTLLRPVGVNCGGSAIW